MIHDALAAVRRFMVAGGQATREPGDYPLTLDPDGLRRRLISEEYHELCDAIANNDLVEYADALADLLYVVLGGAIEAGIPLAHVFEEVHRSNMTKFASGVHRDERGKVTKGPAYEPPNVGMVLDSWEIAPKQISLAALVKALPPQEKALCPQEIMGGWLPRQDQCEGFFGLDRSSCSSDPEERG